MRFLRAVRFGRRGFCGNAFRCRRRGFRRGNVRCRCIFCGSFGRCGNARFVADAEHHFRQILHLGVRMFFEKIEDALNRIGKHGIGRAEFAAHRADERDAFRAAFEQGKSRATQTPAQKIRRVEREASLKFEFLFDVRFHRTHRHLLQKFSGETRRADRAHRLIFSRSEQERARRSRAVERFRLVVLAILDRVAHDGFHLGEPRVHGFLIPNGFETRHKFFERHFREIRGVPIAQNLLIRVVIRRREQLARKSAFRDHREIAFGRFDLDCFHGEKFIRVALERVGERVRFAEERHSVGNAHVEHRRSGLFFIGGNVRRRRFFLRGNERLHRNCEAIRFFENQICDLEKRISARGRFHRLDENVERFFFREKRNFHNARRRERSRMMRTPAMRVPARSISAGTVATRISAKFAARRTIFSAERIARCARIFRARTRRTAIAKRTVTAGGTFPTRSVPATLFARNASDGNFFRAVARCPRGAEAERGKRAQIEFAGKFFINVVAVHKSV